MKISLHHVITLAGAALICVCAGQRVTNEEKKLICEWNNDKVHFRYLVPKSSVGSPKNRWDPSSEPFPADIRECGERAQRYLVKSKGIKERIAIHNVEISSIIDYPTNVAGLLSEGVRTTSRWYLFFNFAFEARTGEVIRPVDSAVVMLLDGTIAEEQTIISGK